MLILHESYSCQKLPRDLVVCATVCLILMEWKYSLNHETESRGSVRKIIQMIIKRNKYNQTKVVILKALILRVLHLEDFIFGINTLTIMEIESELLDQQDS